MALLDGKKLAARVRGEVKQGVADLVAAGSKEPALDVVLVHSDGDDMNIIENEDVLATLDELKREGLVRAFGMSTKTAEGGMWVVQNCDVVMATCNPVDTHDEPVIAEAHRLNKGVLVKKGLQSGHADASGSGQ